MKTWKQFLLISSSVLAIVFSKQIILACADGIDAYYGNTVFFENNVPDKPVYTPFRFTLNAKYYDNSYYHNGRYITEETSKSVNKNALLEEWASYLGHAVKKTDIDSILYGKNGKQILKKIKAKETSQPGNSLTQYLENPKNKTVLNYLIYAKKAEINAQAKEERWPEEDTITPRKTNQELKENGLKSLKQTDDAFLKAKYAFQIIRMAFYDRDYEEVLDLYDNLIGDKSSKSVAYTRILGLKAGAYYHLDQKIKAAYLYSKMFDNNDAYKLDAMKSFNWAMHYNPATKRHNNYPDDKKVDNFDKIYDKADSDHERAVLLVMKGLHSVPYQLETIKKAYKLDPGVEGIDVLINREINKLEDFYFSYKINGQNKLGQSGDSPNTPPAYIRSRYEANQEKDHVTYMDSLNTFTDKLISDRKTGSPALWYLVKAYLATMQNNPDGIQNYLAQADDEEMSPREEALSKRIDLLYTLYKTQDITPKIEKELLPKLKDLNQLINTDDKSLYESYPKKQFEDVMNNLVAGKYFQQGDTIKGIYAMAHSNKSYDYDTNQKKFYADKDFVADRQGELLNAMTPANLKKVIAYRRDSSKTEFENWLVDSTYYTPDVLKELLGTKYIRKGDYKTAAQVLGEDAASDKSYPNPFMPHINDYLELDSRDTIRQYSKQSYSERMAELNEIIENNPHDAGALYGYAVALYNTSYYGKSWQMINYMRRSSDERGYFENEEKDKIMSPYLQEYFRVHKAEKYFKKAAKATDDPELKTKALWGAARSWNKRSPLVLDDYEKEQDYINIREHYDSYYENALNNPYFKKIQENYRNTNYAKEIRTTCDYFADYLQAKR